MALSGIRAHRNEPGQCVRCVCVASLTCAFRHYCVILLQRAEVIATYAMCGFANFGSIGIQIGGLTPLAPHRAKVRGTIPPLYIPNASQP
jgi:hypothetical protein